MAHEILTVKLHELDHRIEQMYSRIELCESGSLSQVEEELVRIRGDCQEQDRILRGRLMNSRAQISGMLSEIYEELDDALVSLREIFSGTRENSSRHPSDTAEEQMEEKLLSAEYALDFAMMADDYALLMALEAIYAQLSQEAQEAQAIRGADAIKELSSTAETAGIRSIADVPETTDMQNMSGTSVTTGIQSRMGAPETAGIQRMAGAPEMAEKQRMAAAQETTDVRGAADSQKVIDTQEAGEEDRIA